MLAWLVLALVTGSLVYCVLAIIAAWKYLQAKPEPAATLPPISILKPLSGADLGLEPNLRTFFEQDYPGFELLFAVRQERDPAVSVVQRLINEYPGVPARLLIVGEPPYPNAKVFSLDAMVAAARYDLLVMSDSDIRVTPELLRRTASEFGDPKVGLTTCPYRAVAGPSFWSRLEAIGMNTEFLAGVLTARMLEGMKFALGPTIAARREALDRIGGMASLRDFLAEDFVMGKRVAEAGFDVLLSSYVIEHHIGSQPFASNLRHRLRWFRSTRRSRPSGYVGQLFTNPLPLALILAAIAPAWWPVLAATIALRTLLGWMTAEAVLHDPLCRSRWWLIPVQDVINFVCWLGGFFGNTISWRGRRYLLLPDGTFQLITDAN